MDKGNHEGDENLTADPPPTAKAARIAGALYLLNAVTSSFSFMYGSRTLLTPGNAALIVPGNATATANSILASEMLFRIGIVSELISGIAFIFLVRALYRLLSGISKAQASLMIAFVLVSVPISFLNVLNEVAALELLHGANFLSAFSQSQLNALAMMFLDLHSQGLVVVAMFWGLWLFPFGILVYRSGFIPRVLGVLLIVNCFTWLAGSLIILLSLPYANLVPLVVTLPLGEPLIIAWLLIKGAKVQSLKAPSRERE